MTSSSFSFVFFLTLLLIVFLVKSQDICGYYWKNYDGDIPDNAFEGGKDSEGNSFYLAMVHLKSSNDTLPGQIIPREKVAVVTFYGRVTFVKSSPTTEIKILCSSDHKGFKWVPTTGQNLSSLSGDGIVYGGTAWGHKWKIGRVRQSKSDVLENVLPHMFEVLVYNCSKKKEEMKKEETTTVDINSDIDETIANIFKGL